MANQPPSDSPAVAEQIIRKRDALIELQAKLLEERREITRQLRQAAQDLDDCRATARFFRLEIEFPEEDDTRMSMSRREHELRMERARVTQANLRHSGGGEIRQLAPQMPTPQVVQSLAAPVESGSTVDSEPPPLREFLLGQLQQIGSTGGKAAGLRALYEQTFAKKIHEKTVGMTLYRLLKQGEVHRDGHTWFYGPAAQVAPETEVKQ